MKIDGLSEVWELTFVSLVQVEQSVEMDVLRTCSGLVISTFDFVNMKPGGDF